MKVQIKCQKKGDSPEEEIFIIGSPYIPTER